MNDMPTPSKIQMVTMTVGYNLGTFINLKVLHGLILDDIIIGIKCDNKTRGNIKTKVNKNTIKTKDFKNQCTLIISSKWTQDGIITTKLINAKLFNNGKIIFTGCTNIEQIIFALNVIANKLYMLESPCDYKMP